MGKRFLNHCFGLVLHLILISPVFKAGAQYYPVGYFISPMDTPLLLSAPFGSLRDNHFHSGMDIRTGEITGLPVYASADGYVSRIKIQSVGYGKALYIDHPNGYTTVYGHLNAYAGEVEGYVKMYQYENQKFEIDHFPDKKALLVRKGQIIGYSGNSGTSSGPHLHFEIRDSRTEQIINPQYFGIVGLDSLPPFIQKIRVYDLSGVIPDPVKDYDLTFHGLHETDSGYWFMDTLEVPEGIVGFGVVAHDFLLNREKEYSVFGLEMDWDKQKKFAFRLSRFAFDKTRSINVHIDYRTYKENNIRFQKLFLDDGNTISLYPYLRNKGKLTVKRGETHLLCIRAADFAGRIFTLYAKVYVASKRLKEPSRQLCELNRIYPGREFYFTDRLFQVKLERNTVYDTSDICIEALETESISPVFRIGDPMIPLQKSFTVLLKPGIHFTSIEASKLCLAHKPQEGKNWRYTGSEKQDSYIVGRTNQFGLFTIIADTISPVIQMIHTQKQIALDDSLGLQFNIEDNFSGIGYYRGTINQKWVLFEYDAKSNLLQYQFDEHTPHGKLEIEIMVSDKKNNTTTLKTTINRQ